MHNRVTSLKEMEEWINTSALHAVIFMTPKQATLIQELLPVHLLKASPMIGYAPSAEFQKTCSRKWTESELFSYQEDKDCGIVCCSLSFCPVLPVFTCLCVPDSYYLYFDTLLRDNNVLIFKYKMYILRGMK